MLCRWPEVCPASGRTLAERAAGPLPTDQTPDVELAGLQDRPRPVLQRHCWVSGLTDAPGRWPGLLVEWRQDPSGWHGRVVYTVPDGLATVVVEAWVPAQHLQPAG